MPDRTTTDEIRDAAAKVSVLLPYRLSAQVRVVQGYSGRKDTLAFCFCQHDFRPDEACGVCEIVEIGDPDLAVLIAQLLRARSSLAMWLLEVASEAEKHAAKGWGNSIDEVAAGHPLAAARAINGSDRG